MKRAPIFGGGQIGGPRKKRSTIGPPAFEQPQLATLVDRVPAGSDWLFEYKYDGYRLLLATGTGAATAWTRRGKDWSDKLRALVKAAANLPPGCLNKRHCLPYLVERGE